MGTKERELEGKKDFGAWVCMVFMYEGWVREDEAFSEKSDKITYFLLHNFSCG